jgi:hypothetical protein
MESEMNKSLESLITTLEEQATQGIAISDQEILRALRLPEVQDELSKYLDQQYSIQECLRVHLTSNPEWVETLVRLSPPPGSASIKPPCVLVTYDGTSGQLISITRQFGETSSLRAQVEGVLPFALSTPSYTEAVRAFEGEPNLVDTNARRQAFLTDLGGLILSTTSSYTTTSQTGYQSAEQTAYSTSGLTTPNDQDARTDYRGDTRTDYRTDTTTDTRADD